MILCKKNPTRLSERRGSLAATTIGNYALFGGGSYRTNETNYYNTVDAYNRNLVRSTPTTLRSSRYDLAATAVGNYALFGGGRDKSLGVSSRVDAYNKSLVRSTPSQLSKARQGLAATSVGNYALLGGGGHKIRVVDAYNSNIRRSKRSVVIIKS